MADLPIPFSAPMIRALQREIEAPGTGKTQTRQVPRIAWKEGANRDFTGWRAERVGPRHWQIVGGFAFAGANLRTAYAPGDRLYVREAVRFCSQMDGIKPSGLSQHEPRLYEADGFIYEPACMMVAPGKLRPPMFVPRWASRITLTVTDVRVQRLNDISEADAQAEGAPAIGADEAPDEDERSHRWGFINLWNSLHGPGAWEANPWVAAYTFTVARGNIDQQGMQHG